MKKMIILACVLLFTTAMFAQEADYDDEGRKIQYRKETVIDFEEMMLQGQIKKPSGSFIMDTAKKKFASLINMKKNFNKELVRSVDLLK